MVEPAQLTENVVMRSLRGTDAPALAAAYRRNREYLAPWEPTRADEFFTEEWQAADIARRMAAAESGAEHAFALVADQLIVGRLTLNRIVRGPFESGGLGYWVDALHAGGGLATAAVAAVITIARDDLGLHRIEASTLVYNTASQRVLLKTGFQQIGMAPRYLRIAGTWQDHILYQVILHD